MNSIQTSFTERMVTSWVRFIERYRVAVIVSMLALTVGSVFYIKDNLGMSTDTTDMLSRDLNWRKLDIEYERLFPQFLDNILVVIEAKTPDQASDTAEQLYIALKDNPSTLRNIYYPSILPYLRQSAFLFLDLDELQDLSDRLATIQPFLGTLLQDQNLRGLFNMLSDAIEAKLDGDDIDLKPILVEINRALEDKDYQVSWQRLMRPEDNPKPVYREFIMLQTSGDDNNSMLPDEAIINHVKSTIESLDLNPNTSIKVRLTGGTVLSYEELKSVSKANIQAIVGSIVLVAIILTVGLGSLSLVSACLLTLITGLITTTAFAAATVGELNLISVAFAVLYIGLGIDFAIHMALRYREERISESNNSSALQGAIRHIYRSLILCAITTAIGFYSFMPTDYVGVAELGWIAGSGMFISLLYTFTLLLALLSFISCKNNHANKKKTGVVLSRLTTIPYKHSKLVLVIAIFFVLGLIPQIDKISFDTNTLNLQDPNNESVQTYRDLLQDSDSSPWNAVLLKQKNADLPIIKQNIESLTLVDKLVSINDFVPNNQEEKLFVIDDMNLLLGDLSTELTVEHINEQERLSAITQLRDKLALIPLDSIEKESQILKQHLDSLVSQTDTFPDEKLGSLEQQLLSSFPGRIKSLADALDAEPVEMQNIPAEIYDRWASESFYKIQIHPVENLNDNDAMKRFVQQLQEYDKDVIGSPVISIEAGYAVITAFKSAFTYALIAIALLLLVLVKVKFDAIIILISVLVGAVFTSGLMLLFEVPLNFANIIGLPLLLGIGVDSGIHIADRFRQEQQSGKNIFMTSSSRGVIVSSLTTICSIGNLAFSSHQGTASMGLLLSLGLASMMISTMMILPAFLIWQNSWNNRA